MGSRRRPYTHDRCGVCRTKTDFKQLPREHDEYGRELMVCTRRNGKIARPGQQRRYDI